MDKPRLTITLDKDIVDKLDEYIDGARIRNRSHAIEYVLSKYFSPKIRKALILTGGKATSLPKGMIEINGRPVLEHTVENLRRYGIREIIFSIGHQGEKIKKHFGDGSRFGVKVTYLEQGEFQTGTAQPIMQAKNELGSSPFMVIYGDVIAQIDLDDMMDFHLSHNGPVTVALTAVNRSSDWGVVRVQGSRIYSFLEKPDNRRDLSNIINAGVYIFDPEIFDYLKDAARLEKDVFPVLVGERKLFGYIFAGDWFDVGNQDSYNRALKEWRN